MPIHYEVENFLSFISHIVCIHIAGFAIQFGYFKVRHLVGYVGVAIIIPIARSVVSIGVLNSDIHRSVVLFARGQEEATPKYGAE